MCPSRLLCGFLAESPLIDVINWCVCINAVFSGVLVYINSWKTDLKIHFVAEVVCCLFLEWGPQ
jgi:hypothetical protein